MDLHILTMSRGDAPRLKEWVLYHHELGFNFFHVILDAPVDESEAILRHLSEEFELSIDITVKDAKGLYFDDLSPKDRWERVKKWRLDNESYIESSGLPIVDPLSDRQYTYLPEKLEELQNNFPDDWVAVIDVDEFIAFPGSKNLKELIKKSSAPRIRFLNFNFDMSNWEPDTPVREQTYRWSRKDIEAYGKGWENRVKSIVKIDHSLPLSSVHVVSKGPFQTLPPTVARLHHYKFPNQLIQIDYSVHDPSIALSSISPSQKKPEKRLQNTIGSLNNLSSTPEFAKLAETIIHYSEVGQLVFSPAKGNWGDGLINIGTRQFLDSLELPFHERNKSSIETDLQSGYFEEKVVLMGGGGAWSRNFSNARKFTDQIARQAKHVIVLPTTFDLPPVEPNNVTYFARDKFTSLDTNPQAVFCHDMALFINLELHEPTNRVWRLFAMRNDREGTNLAKHVPQNFDLSKLGDGDYAFADPLFNILNNFNIICTDRLHLAIASAMLGRKVKLLPGNYAKSQDVFLSSLKENYPQVELTSKNELLEWLNPAAHG
ncbi:glycosyltransferase family 2 protein [Corynebacterium sp. HMSC062A03]|uniref:glycosyltransferase family 2 protein n=1 Tax=Corynebacterium sp. HMSC062A03 TaxID=1739285 RepID=UPI0008A38C7D|nr:glycosyltransferase family 2 protein [Corynebacterium sp. HMSC062A03]OFL19369.1 hypothetical protein HMPREF2781_02225 [Corynebacterium sp. HMSC062A03]